MLSRIQQLLAELYDLSPVADVQGFVCGGDLVREVADGAQHRGEALLVLEEDDDLHIALYLDPAVLHALVGEGDGWALDRLEAFHAMCLATEGVSHFLYLTFRADNAEQVSQLELELQAEVDKYAAGLLAGNGVGAIRERSRALRERLFTSVRFIDSADSAEGERYRIAHRAAARYAASLEERFVERGRLSELWTELRRFYRMGAQQKLKECLL